MSISNWTNQSSILVDSEQVEECQDFCYLGSTVTSDEGYDTVMTGTQCLE